MKFIKNKLLKAIDYMTKVFSKVCNSARKYDENMSSIRKLRCSGLPHLDFPNEEGTYGLRIISKTKETIRIQRKDRSVLDEILNWFESEGTQTYKFEGKNESILILKRENIDHIILNKF